jgi:hypothetical protein
MSRCCVPSKRVFGRRRAPAVGRRHMTQNLGSFVSSLICFPGLPDAGAAPRNRDGRSRQLGFIGFKSVDDAVAALRYYDRSFMDTSKLTVEVGFERVSCRRPGVMSATLQPCTKCGHPSHCLVLSGAGKGVAGEITSAASCTATGGPRRQPCPCTDPLSHARLC